MKFFSLAAGLGFQAAPICGAAWLSCGVPIPFLSLGWGASDPRRDLGRVSRTFRSRSRRRSLTGSVEILAR